MKLNVTIVGADQARAPWASATAASETDRPIRAVCRPYTRAAARRLAVAWSSAGFHLPIHRCGLAQDRAFK